MNDIAALGLLWLFSQGFGKPTQRAPAPLAEPRWPTPLSPPPPLPAFQSQIPPIPAAAPSADTGTPLSQLHQAPPKVRPADKGNAAATREAATRARAAAAAAASAARDKHTIKVPLHVSVPARPAKSERTAAAVIDLQKVINARGGKLKQDGLYGPKTASAWSALARSKGLPATITRGGPRTAMVDSRTLDTLRVPAIP